MEEFATLVKKLDNNRKVIYNDTNPIVEDLYVLVDDYVRDNRLFLLRNAGCSYNVRIENTIYMVGIIYGTGKIPNYFYIREVRNNNNIIDLKDVIENKKSFGKVLK